MAQILSPTRLSRPAVTVGPVLLAMAALALSPRPVHAAGFVPPAGCTLELTAQNRGCTVSQYYRCEGDPAGIQHSAIFGKEGLFHLSTIDDETRWIESQDPVTGLTDLLDEETDPASFGNLIATGRDDFDFWTQSSSGERLHHQGHDELTGKTKVIDGLPLEVTRFELTTRSEAGEVLITRRGSQFVSRDNRRFYGGIETQTDWTGMRRDSNDSPMLFSKPGEPGSANTTPQFDCEQLMTQIAQERAAS